VGVPQDMADNEIILTLVAALAQEEFVATLFHPHAVQKRTCGNHTRSMFWMATAMTTRSFCTK
jgi:hypothetical protein